MLDKFGVGWHQSVSRGTLQRWTVYARGAMCLSIEEGVCVISSWVDIATMNARN